MKKQFLILFAIAAFTTGLATSAFGQAGKTVQANVTFNFQIGARSYPAGKYRIESLGRLSDRILQIRSLRDSKTNQLVLATHLNAGKNQAPRLVFRKYGEDYVLTEIVLGFDQWSYSISPVRKNRERENVVASRSIRIN